MTDNSSPRRERGTALLVWLIVLALLVLWSLYRGIEAYNDWIGQHRPSSHEEWQFLLPLALTIIQGLGIVALWRCGSGTAGACTCSSAAMRWA